jgi:lysophospholipase L1-like esterase
MSATHGLARKLRSRSRLIGCTLAAAFALSALLASSAGAVPIKETYLAMGDSLAFGYSQQLFNEHIGVGEPAAAFEHGYVNDFWKAHLKPGTGDQLQNLGCPGETTDSLFGTGPVGKALDPTGEAPCAYHEVDAEANGFPAGFKFPLHNEYGGAGVSQLEAALGYIAQDAALGRPVTEVTLNIGANDQLHAIAKCQAQAEKEVGEKIAKGELNPAEAEAAVKQLTTLCIVANVEALGNHIGKNIATIVFALRNGGNLFGGVNYTGKIVFVGAYNPDGNVAKFPTKKEEVEGINYEVLKGSNGLAKKFNAGFGGAATNPEANEGHPACFANTLPRFNTENGMEPRHLQKWTNMTNTSKVEFPPTSGKFLNNGPDIHATPEGYKVMSNVIIQSCP